MTAFRGQFAPSGGRCVLAAFVIAAIFAQSRLASAQAPVPPSASPPAPVVSPAPSTTPGVPPPSAAIDRPAPVTAPPPAATTPSSNDSEFAFSGLADVTAPTNGDAPYMIGDFFIR